MSNYLIINDDTAQVTILKSYLEKISSVSFNQILDYKTFTEKIDHVELYDAVIINIKLLAEFNLEKLKILHPKLLIVCTGTLTELMNQKPNDLIFSFLVQPITFERIFTLNKNIEDLIAQKEEKRQPTFLFVKADYKLIKVMLADILFLSGLRDYTQVFLRGKSTPITTLQNLKEFENKLAGEEFIRVHRSYIVALSQVDAISRNEIIIGPHTIPIGNAYKKSLHDIVQKNS